MALSITANVRCTMISLKIINIIQYIHTACMPVTAAVFQKCFVFLMIDKQ